MTSADEMIEKIDDIRKQLNQRQFGIDCEIDGISEKWAQLKSMKAERADHGALLLAQLRPHLRDISEFCVRCEKQLDQLVANPFGREPA